VKHWKETTEILARVNRLEESGQRAAVATVVKISGSAYRRPGAKLLIDDAGGAAGSISGGCLEADVREVALRVLRGEAPTLLHYDTSADDRSVWGLALGCSGAIDVFVQPYGKDTRAAVERIRELLQGDKPFAVSTVIEAATGVGRVVVVDSSAAAAGTTGDSALDSAIASQARRLLDRRETALYETDSVKIFTEVLVPPPYLVIFGAGDDAIPLCAYASDVGLRVVVVDHRAALLSKERFPGASRCHRMRPEEGSSGLPLGPNAYTVVKTHSFGHDREWVRQLLAAGVPYVGVVGPRARTRKLLEEIGASGSNRVFGPVGLDLGAEGPEQVALSIVAEILAARSSREPRPLSEREGAIHAN
jgi:xanthine dehydrogenase accessory factor